MQSTPSHTLNIASEIEIQTINNAQCEDSTFNLDTSESFTGGDECQLSSTETIAKQAPHLSRKRQRNETEWKQNVRKRRRQEGKEYTNRNGDRIPMRCSTEASCKCKYKCISKIHKIHRQSIFRDYWSMTFQSQRTFIHKNVHVITKKRRSQTDTMSRRTNTYQYFLPTEEGNCVQVCKLFFLQALGIREKTVHYTMKKRT